MASAGHALTGMICLSRERARRSLAPGPETSTYASPLGRPSEPMTSLTLSSVKVPQPCNQAWQLGPHADGAGSGRDSMPVMHAEPSRMAC